jgi:hypothetical protein
MFVRAFVFAAVMVMGGATAFAEGEGNNPAAVEVPAGTGVYYATVQPAPAGGAMTARATQVAQAPAARR